MANVIRFVNTASTPGGDGTTVNTSGSTRAYASLNEWEAAEGTDLVTALDTHTVRCSGTAADTTAVTIDSFTTNATYFVSVKGNRSVPSGFNTKIAFSANHYRLEFNNPTATPLRVLDPYTRIDGIQIKTTGTTSSLSHILTVPANGVAVGNVRILNTNTALNAIYIRAEDGDAHLILNNIVENTGNIGSGIGIIAGLGPYDIDCYNNTVHGFDIGIETITQSSFTTNIKNNCVFNNDDDFAAAGTGTTNIDYNASDDGDGTNSQDMSPGGTESDGWNAALTNYSGGDLTPKNINSVLYENGVDNATDSNVPPTDVIENSRATAATEIGAFEFISTTFRPSTFIVIGIV